MIDFTPKPEHKFTFGLWTVGSIGRDPFGAPVRELKTPAELVYLLGEVGAYGVNFHDNDLIPIDATSGEAEAVKKYNYTGVVGQILDYADYGHVVVQCGSGYLIIKHIEIDGEQKVPTAILKVGSRWSRSGLYLPPTNG